MSIERFLVRDVAILTARTVADRYNNTVPDWEDTVRDEVKGWFGRNSATEEGTNRDGFITSGTLRLPPGTTITAGDLVEIDGATYHVEGPPIRAWTPRGEHHVRAELRLVEG